MPIRFSGSARPRRLKSPDPAQIPTVRENRVPRVYAEVAYYKANGEMPDQTDPAVVYNISSNDASGSFDPAGAFYLTDVLRTTTKTYSGAYASVQRADDWSEAQVTNVSDNQIKTFPILPGQDFSLTIDCRRFTFGTNISAFVALDDQNYQGTSCAPLFYWWWQTANDGRQWNQVTPYGTYYTSNTVGALDMEFDTTAGGGWDFLNLQTFKVTKVGTVVTMYINGVQVGTTTWTYDNTFAPTLRLRANNSRTQAGNFTLTVTDPNV